MYTSFLQISASQEADAKNETWYFFPGRTHETLEGRLSPNEKIKQSNFEEVWVSASSKIKIFDFYLARITDGGVLVETISYLFCYFELSKNQNTAGFHYEKRSWRKTTNLTL